MRRIALLGLIVLFAGCGRCWSPMFRGAPCQGSCGVTAPALPASHATGCVGCAANGTSAGYSSYDGSEGVIAGDYIGGNDYYGDSNGIIQSGIVNERIVNEGIISSPSMVPLTN